MVVRDGRPFRLRPSTITSLHQVAMKGVRRLAGTYRASPVRISGSKHLPPDAATVAGHVEDMCEWIEAQWETRSAISLAAYIMWRLNWIHPFDDGNGRTTRAVAYLVLSAKSGHRLPGSPTIPEQIANEKGSYYSALEEADAAAERGEYDLSSMEGLLRTYLARQLKAAFDDADRAELEDASDRKFH
ncbi:MAG TPA: Fic family protein [Allosphingosinicella sp.]